MAKLKKSHKKVDPSKKRLITLLSVTLLLAGISLTTFNYYDKPKEESSSQLMTLSDCDASEEKIRSADIDYMPCRVVIVLKDSYLKISHAKIDEIVRPVNGKLMRCIDDLGICIIKVESGKEYEAIKYLEKKREFEVVILDMISKPDSCQESTC